MLKKIVGFTVALFGISTVYASEQVAQAVAVTQQAMPSVAGYLGSTVSATMIGLGIAAGLCGIGQGIAVANALSGISRQPEATAKIQLNMIVGLAFIESLVLYTLFIGIVLLFVNPFMKYLVG